MSGKARHGALEVAFVGLVFALGLWLRLRLATGTYLNPDEAVHVLISVYAGSDTAHSSVFDVTHPPLLLYVTRLISRISRTELALRAVPVLAGSLFPVLIWMWLRRMAGDIAGLAALILLTFAPHLITVSAQVRSYTLAFVLLAASLVVLEEALDRQRAMIMALYSVLLWLCIFSDYSMAWFAGAAGVYALLRLRGSPKSLKATWLGGQIGALMLYGFLFIKQVRKFRGGPIEGDAVGGWLADGFPKWANLFTFPVVNTPKQFEYLMASVPLGVVTLLLFVSAIILLWTGKTRIEQAKARALAVLLVLPFLLAIAGAYADLFPYGRSRHTLVMGLFGAVGGAIFLGTLPRRMGVAVIAGMSALTPLWYWKADLDPQDIDPARHQKLLMLESMDYMRAKIPPGSLVFSNWQTLFPLLYYAGFDELPDPSEIDDGFREITVGGRWRVFARDYQYPTNEKYTAALTAFRRHHGMKSDEPVWVLDGGWTPLRPADEKLPFSRAVRVFQAGAP